MSAYLRKRKSASRGAMSALCQERTLMPLLSQSLPLRQVSHGRLLGIYPPLCWTPAREVAAPQPLSHVSGPRGAGTRAASR